MANRIVTGLLLSGALLAATPALADHRRWQAPPAARIGVGGLWLDATPGGGLALGSGRSPVVVYVDPRGGFNPYVGGVADGWYGPPGQWGRNGRGRGRFAPGWDGRRYPHPRQAGWYDRGWDDGRWNSRHRDDRRWRGGRRCDD